MSTIEVSNYSDGTDTVGSEYLVNGSAKAWSSIDGIGTVSVYDSLNVSSITDAGVGIYDSNFTNSMNGQDDYTVSIESNIDGAFRTSGGNSTSKVVAVARNSSFAATDVDPIFTTVHGDLA